LLFTFLLVIPFILWIGVRSELALVVLGVVIAINIAASNIIARLRRPITNAHTTIAAVLFSILIGVFARPVTPFLMVPAIAGASVMLFVVDPRASPRVIVALMIAASLGPWAFELLHLVPQTMTVVNGDLVLRWDLAIASSPRTEIGLAVFAIANLIVMGMVTRQIAVQQRTTLRTVELQAWHLRQLVKS